MEYESDCIAWAVSFLPLARFLIVCVALALVSAGLILAGEWALKRDTDRRGGL